MVSFETVNEKTIVFGIDNFIEIARKKFVAKDGNVSEFIGISRGYIKKSDGTKKFKKSVSIPDDDEVKQFIADFIMEV